MQLKDLYVYRVFMEQNELKKLCKLLNHLNMEVFTKVFATEKAKDYIKNDK